MATARQLLVEGLSDAAGFVAGALLGFGLGKLLGLDLFASGYGPTTLAAIVLIGLLGGAGLQAARLWRSERNKKHEP
ncbi:hypothetical protein N0K08_05800 [Acidovorax sp. Be4]|jgi:F0F1-type ATP synthase assembly protein I|uniref:AtpZ/AtpI family protein n=1 Tax=Acidovorax bellezanensis TaxID=2976702 RepID=A0ABT2PLK6_9BURK|nr:hypothetical protein [Acidovorax sp. Be4]MCT9810137.1 hypothetical protein [Acidovorax sp. Be4]